MTARPVESISSRRAADLGQRVRDMAALAKAGLPVPQAYVVSGKRVGRHLRNALGEAHTPVALLSSLREAATPVELKQLRERLLAHDLSEELTADLCAARADLVGAGARAVTLAASVVSDRPELEQVRPSAFLGLASDDALLAAARSAMLLLLDRELLARGRAADAHQLGLALVVQRMVDGRVSGVAYSRHPVSGRATDVTVQAGFGLAGAVAAGESPSDQWQISRRDQWLVDRVIMDKHTQVTTGAEGARVRVSVPQAVRGEASIDDATAVDVARLCVRAERLLSAPCRMQWGLDDGQLYVLRTQAMPGKPASNRLPRPAVERASWVWSNHEVGEALPRVLTPLTWSMLQNFAREGLDHAFAAIGVRTPRGPDLLGQFRGRAYLNMSALTGAVASLPGVEMENLRHLRLDAFEPTGRSASALWRVPLTAGKVLRAHRRLPERVEQLRSRLTTEQAHFSGLDARLLSPDALDRLLSDAEQWLHATGSSLLGAYGVWLVNLMVLRSVLDRYLGEAAVRCETELLWGVQELPTASAGLLLHDLSLELKTNPEVQAWAQDQSAPTPRVIEAAVEQFLQAHGAEGPCCIDPASPRWRERPGHIEGVLRALLRGGGPSGGRRQVAAGRRERAERELRNALPLVLRPAVQVMVNRVRRLTRQRDELLLDTIYAVDLVRGIALDACQRLAVHDTRWGPDAAFFFTLDELHELLSKAHWQLGERSRVRRRAFATEARQPVAPALFRGQPTHSDVPTQLRGRAGSYGTATGTVRIMRSGRSLADVRKGDVLVVEALDVGLSAVLPVAGAVVAERGGSLSHGTMVAAALGIPAVVGLRDACSRLEEGTTVRVDAETFEVLPVPVSERSDSSEPRDATSASEGDAR